jgi:hypothetical protein
MKQRTRHRILFLAVVLLAPACLARGGGALRVGAASSSGTGPDPDAGGEASSYGGPADPSTGGSGATAAPAGAAEPRWDDFAFAVRESTGTYYGPWIITKFTTFKVGATCWGKLADPQGDAVRTAGYYIRSVHELGKILTGEDWDRIEGQRSDRAKDRTLVEPIMDAFAQQFHLTIAVEGDDCEVERDALWLRYWFHLGETIAKYPTLSGKLFVTLNVANTREVSVDVDDTGSQFTITVPRDIEPKDWQEKMDRPFRKVARKL